MKFNVIEGLREHKTTALMIFGTLTEVGAIVLAIRNGVKAKQALDDLDEDATVGEKALAIAPTMAPVAALAILSVGSYWWAEHINVDKIVSMGSTIAMLKMRSENQDAAMRENLDEETYDKIRTAENDKDSEYHAALNKTPQLGHTGLKTGVIFEDPITGVGIEATDDWIHRQFNQWGKDYGSGEYEAPGNKNWVPMWTLTEGYLMEGTSRMRDVGWRLSDLGKLKLKTYTNLRHAPSDNQYGKPLYLMMFSIPPQPIPDEELPFRPDKTYRKRQ